MLRDIAGIRLCGANFDEVTNILLLDPHEGNKVKPVKGTSLSVLPRSFQKHL